MVQLRADYFDIMLRSQKGYARVMDPVCREWSLTRNELDILLFLHSNPELDRASDIVAKRGICKSHISLSVSSLEKRGLILCRDDPEDRRSIHLVLTDTGYTVVTQGRAAQEAFFRKLYHGLTEEELEQWQRIICKVSENIANLEI